MTFDYYLRCPQLVLTADFNTSGTKNFTQLDGEGTTKITAGNFCFCVLRIIFGYRCENSNFIYKSHLKYVDAEDNGCA